MAALQQTWDDQRLRRERVQRLQERMRERNIGAMYLTDVNLHYALCMKVPGSAAFVPAEGDLVVFVRPRDDGWVRRQGVRVERTFYDGASRREPGGERKFARFGQAIANLMIESGVSGEPLGIDELEAAAFLALQGAGIRIVDASAAIEMARSVKTRDEVAIYRYIARQYEDTFKAFAAAVRPGLSEKQLAEVAVSAWKDAGGEDVSQINVCAGENMNPWSRWPTDRAVRAGEFVGIDFHARGPHGLRGNVSRTYLVGEDPTREHLDLYRLAYDHLRSTIGAVQAGRSLSDVLRAVPTVPMKYRAQLDHRAILHSLGMTPSGYPQLDRNKSPVDDILRPNQVFAVDCYFGEEGSPLAVKLEEQILVRDGGVEVLGAEIPFDNRLIS